MELIIRDQFLNGLTDIVIRLRGILHIADNLCKPCMYILASDAVNPNKEHLGKWYRLPDDRHVIVESTIDYMLAHVSEYDFKSAVLPHFASICARNGLGVLYATDPEIYLRIYICISRDPRYVPSERQLVEGNLRSNPMIAYNLMYGGLRDTLKSFIDQCISHISESKRPCVIRAYDYTRVGIAWIFTNDTSTDTGIILHRSLSPVLLSNAIGYNDFALVNACCVMSDYDGKLIAYYDKCTNEIVINITDNVITNINAQLYVAIRRQQNLVIALTNIIASYPIHIDTVHITDSMVNLYDACYVDPVTYCHYYVTMTSNVPELFVYVVDTSIISPEYDTQIYPYLNTAVNQLKRYTIQIAWMYGSTPRKVISITLHE